MPQPAQRKSLHCPKCGGTYTKVYNSRSNPDEPHVWRRRRCPGCKHTFTTSERLGPPPAPKAPETNVRRAVAINGPNVVVLDAGVYWWRKDSATEWQLADVLYHEGRFVARFFNGAHITDKPWGEWIPVSIERPS